MSIVSILVPVYKVEAYLQRCIDSVLSQDFQDWEMILVDDGSPDRCPQICDEAAEKDMRIKVVHKENGGLVSARQCGVMNATGKYLMFLDSDDTLTSCALSTLVKEIDKGYDAVRGLLLRINTTTNNSFIENNRVDYNVITNSNEYLLALYLGDVQPYLCGGLYRSSLFTPSDFDLIIESGFSVSEDWIINMIIGDRIHSIRYVNNIVYNYYCNSSSMMNSYVISLDYIEKVDELLSKTGVFNNMIIMDSKSLKHCITSVESFFKPEILFSLKRYKKIISYINKGSNYQSLSCRVDVRYLKYIHCLPLYYIYTTIYALLYLLIKQKGKKRKVLY